MSDPFPVFAYDMHEIEEFLHRVQFVPQTPFPVGRGLEDVHVFVAGVGEFVQDNGRGKKSYGQRE